MTSAAPSWFERALQRPRQSHFTDASGARIHYVSWNAEDTHKPGLLFAHGYLGHSHWWDFIAPFFTERFRVHAFDFSGMGESGYRAEYRPDSFVRDFSAVLKAAFIAPAFVVGHSFGGSRLLQTCATFPELIRHAIVLDSFYALPGDALPVIEGRPAPRPYLDAATGMRHFRLIPDQKCEPWLMDHLARTSLRQAETGWTWRFDPALRHVQTVESDEGLLGRITVPVTYVHAEMSTVVSADRANRIIGAIPTARNLITMPGAHHHLMLDNPLALVDQLRKLLEQLL
ncbi:alpha/beta fold hydrolase [Paraburkholderia sp. BL25I1N1]|uniref:alpha/beta fold hydrolase n=1 Tax=Paraburkholderia sp. BL25I1N1 TaxID=1938804 RepID=UPI000D07335A|nr:alpha/beta hydrolase [Paraburkholderia sp. BL25I1N1]PRX95795.1 pimeloyl-ACP methyl ester carboxylesterase [Paraburkholderia sp. BL25I1N1]